MELPWTVLGAVVFLWGRQLLFFIFRAPVGQMHPGLLHWAAWLLECDNGVGCSTGLQVVSQPAAA